MTQEELIQEVKNGKRIHTESSLHKQEKQPCEYHEHFWRTIVCDGEDWDVVECSTCGQQRIMRCNFDDEYS